VKVGGASKIKSDGASAYAGQGSGKGGAVSGVSGASRAFSDVADEIESRALIAELDELGAELSRYPTSELLRRYRELVRMAIARVKDGTRIKREFKWRRTERSMFITVERAEGALEELGELETALDRERERTRVCELVDEIKGCLISLLF
jgi:uncharacterized protein YaaR (DUF327 family)